MNIVSFEYILLEFKKLTDWVFAEDDDFRFQRSDLLKAREMLITAINENEDYKSVPEIRKIFLQINEYNIEQFVSKLLYLITRNTGFEVTKGSLGICWRADCCSFSMRQPDDLCGLDKSRLPLHDKMLQIMKNTGLQSELIFLEG